MAARHVELCEAIKTYIESGTFSQTFTTLRRNIVEQDLADSQFTKVVVTPGLRALGSDIDANTRADILKQYQVRIHLLNFLEQGQSEEDTSLLLLEEIEDHMIYADVDDFRFLSFVSDAAPEQPFDVELQQGSAFFYSLITVDYLDCKE